MDRHETDGDELTILSMIEPVTRAVCHAFKVPHLGEVIDRSRESIAYEVADEIIAASVGATVCVAQERGFWKPKVEPEAPERRLDAETKTSLDLIKRIEATDARFREIMTIDVALAQIDSIVETVTAAVSRHFKLEHVYQLFAGKTEEEAREVCYEVGLAYVCSAWRELRQRGYIPKKEATP